MGQGGGAGEGEGEGEGEGGWYLPFRDRGERKRGGIQVDDTAPVARLDGD